MVFFLISQRFFEEKKTLHEMWISLMRHHIVSPACVKMNRQGGGEVTSVAILQLTGQPIQAFVKTVARRGARSLNVPVAIA